MARRLPIGVLCGIALLLASCGSSKIEPIHSKALFGFNDEPTPGTFAPQAKLNMPVRRIAMRWQLVEPVQGRWDWSQYDADYRDMLNHGLRPLIVAIGGPCWAAPGSTCTNGAAVPDSRFDSAWAEYVRRLAQRYPDAIGIEVWNEPNSRSQFPPRPDPARFTALLAAAYRAVKSVDPKLPVISGGLLPARTTGPNAIADHEFLAAIYRAGAARWMDALGAHPYPVAFALGGLGGTYDQGATEDDLNGLRAVRDAAGARSTPIWITELGVSSSSGPSLTSGVSESEQGRDLVDLLRSVGGDPDVRVVLVHRLVDPPASVATNPAAALQLGFGVFNTDLSPKPAACDLSTAFGGSLSC